MALVLTAGLGDETYMMYVWALDLSLSDTLDILSGPFRFLTFMLPVGSMTRGLLQTYRMYVWALHFPINPNPKGDTFSLDSLVGLYRGEFLNI